MIQKRINELGIRIPKPEKTVFAYIPISIHKDVAYLAGQIPKCDGRLFASGRIGAEVTPADAKESARICVLQALGWLQEYIGTLDNVDRILRMDAYLAVAPGFENLSEIVDVASELLVSLFGEPGRHPRSVIGVAFLPRNAPILIELTVAIKRQ
jgi:enamine deaminase RidA (YjgF/YER057c/UK114 family)